MAIPVGTSTLLSLVTEFMRRMGLGNPGSVVTSTNEAILQIWGLLNEEVTELADRFEWQELIQILGFSVDQTMTGTASYYYGNIGLKYIIRDTFWNTTRKLPVRGPVPVIEWEEIVTRGISSSYEQYTLRNNIIQIYPRPQNATVYELQYQSQWPVYVVSGGNISGPKASFTADTDACVLPDRIVLSGLRWRYKKEKGLPYAEDQRSYESLVQGAINAQGTSGEVHLDQHSHNARPGIFVNPWHTVP